MVESAHALAGHDHAWATRVIVDMRLLATVLGVGRAAIVIVVMMVTVVMMVGVVMMVMMAMMNMTRVVIRMCVNEKT
jgi:hypothetical protein